jgi:hypothetical protein
MINAPMIMDEHEKCFNTYRFLSAEDEPEENCQENNHNGSDNSNSQIWLLLALFNDFLQRSIKFRSYSMSTKRGGKCKFNI